MSDTPAPQQPVAPVLKLIPGSGKLNSEWALTGDYDEHDVYVKATDKQGHSERPKVTMPPHLWNEICALVAEKKIPGYNTPIDFMRDSAYHRLHYWREQLPDLDWREFDIAEALAATERKIAGQAERTALVESCETLLKGAMDVQAWGKVNEALEFVNEVAEGVKDEPWHGQLMGLIEDYRTRLQSLK